MGTILDGFGDDAYDHEGHASPAGVGRVIAACSCGWTGRMRYPITGRGDDDAEGLALGEREHEHARPTFDALRALDWDRLHRVLRGLANSRLAASSVQFRELSSAEQCALLDRTLAEFARATKLIRQLRVPLKSPPGGVR